MNNTRSPPLHVAAESLHAHRTRLGLPILPIIWLSHNRTVYVHVRRLFQRELFVTPPLHSLFALCREQQQMYYFLLIMFPFIYFLFGFSTRERNIKHHLFYSFFFRLENVIWILCFRPGYKIVAFRHDLFFSLVWSFHVSHTERFVFSLLTQTWNVSFIIQDGFKQNTTNLTQPGVFSILLVREKKILLSRAKALVC